jgi:hypothetical protein
MVAVVRKLRKEEQVVRSVAKRYYFATSSLAGSGMPIDWWGKDIEGRMRGEEST